MTEHQRILWESGGPVWHTDKPDADNSVKALQDALVKRGWIERDEQVVHPNITKIRCGNPGITIQIHHYDILPVVIFSSYMSGRNVTPATSAKIEEEAA